MKKFLSKRENLLVFSTLAIFLFSLGLNTFIIPLMKKNDELNKRIKKNSLKLKKYAWLMSRKDSLEQGYLKLFNSNFSEPRLGSQNLSALSEIKQLAKEANINIIDIRPQTGSLKEMEIELRTEGQLPDYLRFIYTVELSMNLLSIKSFQLNALPNSALLEGIFSISQRLSE